MRESTIRPLWLAAGGALAAGLALRALARSRRYFDLRNRTVFITGGSRGLGLVLARQCVDRGANVAICARSEEELLDARRQLQDRGAGVLAIQGDVSIQSLAEEMVRETVSRFGAVDVLINNAGTIQVGPMRTMTIADYQEAMNLHFYAPLYLTNAVLPLMRGRGEGRIVNITSIGGKLAAPHLLPYTASKFALVGLSEGLRVELAHENIFVTTVVPGLFRSGSPRNAFFKGQNLKEYAWFSTADVLPFVSIAPERLARKILDAMQHGQAELIAPLIANLQAKFWAVFPNFAEEITALFNRALPATGGIGAVRMMGKESDSDRAPDFARDRNRTAAAAHNEL